MPYRMMGNVPAATIGITVQRARDTHQGCHLAHFHPGRLLASPATSVRARTLSRRARNAFERCTTGVVQLPGPSFLQDQDPAQHEVAEVLF
jgi:hypothetical protein